jgi:hypothetical protein
MRPRNVEAAIAVVAEHPAAQGTDIVFQLARALHHPNMQWCTQHKPRVKSAAANAIDSFVWYDSPQGYDYWSVAYDKFEKFNK